VSDPDVIRQKGQRIESRCPTCRDAVKPGLLWIGGKDYVECPDCGGPSGGHPGVFRMWEKIITPPKSFAVDGLKGPIIASGFAHSPEAPVAVPVKIRE
jgi:NAD-dependent SIR2 family protein deacetylase